MKDNRESEQNRYSLLTVRDAEIAMTIFTIFAVAVIIWVFFHELLITRGSIVGSFYFVCENISKILSASTLLTIFEEGVDLMFLRRTREELEKFRELEISVAGEDNQAVLQQVREWNTRRLEAESRNEPFNEPLPDKLELLFKVPKRSLLRILFSFFSRKK